VGVMESCRNRRMEYEGVKLNNDDGN